MTEIDASLIHLVSAAGDRKAETPVSALFLKRWSARAMTGEPIPEKLLHCLLEAARYAPSAYNAQPWRFVYARKGEPAFDALLGALVESNRVWAQNASALILAASKAEFTPPGHAEPAVLGSASFDTGAAWASLAFQAALLGLTTHAMAGFDAQKARAAVKAPENLKMEVVIAVGRRGDPQNLPAEKQALEHPNARRPLAQTAFAGVFPDEA
jgi:nitroreductase